MYYISSTCAVLRIIFWGRRKLSISYWVVVSKVRSATVFTLCYLSNASKRCSVLTLYVVRIHHNFQFWRQDIRYETRSFVKKKNTQHRSQQWCLNYPMAWVRDLSYPILRTIWHQPVNQFPIQRASIPCQLNFSRSRGRRALAHALLGSTVVKDNLRPYLYFRDTSRVQPRRSIRTI